MARKRKPDRPPRRSDRTPSGSRPVRPALQVTARPLKDGSGWELVHPRCALERAEDMEEVQAMIAQGDTEVALDELRWLLEGCSDFLDAHYTLGVLAVDEDRDFTLARAHFGYAYQLGITALRRAGNPQPVPYSVPANQAFFEAGKGLAYSLRELGKHRMAAEVLDELIRLDPAAPLGLVEMREKLSPQNDSVEAKDASDNDD